jgi:hypothetical protein
MTKFVELNSNHFVNADRIAEVRFRRAEVRGEWCDVEAAVIMADGETVRSSSLRHEDLERLGAEYLPAAPGWAVVETWPAGEWEVGEQPAVAWRVAEGIMEHMLMPITLMDGEVTPDSHGLHGRELDLGSVYFTAVRAPSGQVSIIGDQKFDDVSQWLDYCKEQLAGARESQREAGEAEAAAKSKKPAPIGSPAR